MEEKLKSLERQIAKLKPEVPESGEDAKSGIKGQVSDKDAEKVVRSAYLRTLTREPTPEELSRSLSFIANSEKPAEGIEGVLWALINTKEFSLNH